MHLKIPSDQGQPLCWGLVEFLNWIGRKPHWYFSPRLVPVSSIRLLHYKQENLDQARLDNFAHMGIQLHPGKFLDVITHPYPNFNGGSRGWGGGWGRKMWSALCPVNWSMNWLSWANLPTKSLPCVFDCLRNVHGNLSGSFILGPQMHTAVRQCLFFGNTHPSRFK